ncbi:hypothetical protein N7G274_010069 [Stereocaulon virgatum]|uniref:Uncharacterized protein n=1 Tax=Stereocaulon virgatum TaxID=373712 RepID=A0ABR3ZX01_9LECA
MFLSISRLGLAAFVPAIVLAQSTTYFFTVSGTVQSIVLPTAPTTTTTIYMTQPAAIVTVTPPASIETRIFTVTGPAPVVASIEGALPSGAQVQGSTESPGPIVPIAINGFTTSIQFPVSASIPTSGPVTIAPAVVVAPTPASMAFNAQPATSNEAVVASNFNGTPVITYNPIAANTVTNAAASPTPTTNSVPANIPIPLGPLSSLSASLQSASSAALTASSGPAAVDTSSASAASAAGTVTNSVPTLITTATGSPTETGTVSTTVTTPATLLTTTSGAPVSTATATSSVAATTTASTARQSQSSSSPAPSSSSTAAPTHSGAGIGASRVLWREGLGLLAGFAAFLLML